MFTCSACGSPLTSDVVNYGSDPQYPLCDACIGDMIADMEEEEHRRKNNYTCGLCGGRVMDGQCFACSAVNPPVGNKKEVV